MRIKLDENFDVRLVPLLAEEGHDADTVRNEHLSGVADEAIYDVCVNTGRTLITLDLDFSNPFRYPPEATEGIIVIRPKRAVLPLIRMALEQTLPALKTHSPKGKLWVVEPGRIREYESPARPDDL